MRRKRKSDSLSVQIDITDIKLKIGDKLYKNGSLYGEIKDESSTLFFISRAFSDDIIPSPYIKEKLIESILMGTFTLDEVNYE